MWVKNVAFSNAELTFGGNKLQIQIQIQKQKQTSSGATRL